MFTLISYWLSNSTSNIFFFLVQNSTSNLFGMYGLTLHCLVTRNMSKVRLLIWHVTVWKIWEARNRTIFASKVSVVEDLVDDIKTTTSWRSFLVRKEVELLCITGFLIFFAFSALFWWTFFGCVKYPLYLYLACGFCTFCTSLIFI